MDSATRSLKKYEAEPLVVKTTAGSRSDMELFSPFGPFIAKTGLSSALIERINRHVDVELEQAGVRGAEFILPQALVESGGEDSLAYHLAKNIIAYVEASEGSRVASVRLDAIWIVNQQQASPSPVHFHSADVSGVLYLQTPDIDESELQRNYISGRNAGYLNLLSGGKQALNKSLISFKPVVGDLYIFPGWLLHGVEPFRGEGERRSLAFNAQVTLEE
ncbi:MAG: putative 2OG-Fe(II) oxygenase [Cellvibrionaceae bacterium]